MPQVLEDFLEQNKESRNSDTDFEVKKFKKLAEELRRCNEADVCQSSPTSSEYSTGSTMLSNAPHDEKEECETENVLDSESQHFVVKKSAVCHTNEGMKKRHISLLLYLIFFKQISEKLMIFLCSSSEEHVSK